MAQMLPLGKDGAARRHRRRTRVAAAGLALAAAAAVAGGPADARPARPTGEGPGPSAGVWPVDGAVVVRVFSPPPLPWRTGHRGVDLLAAPGALVRSPVAGTVAFAATVVDRPVLVIADGPMRVSFEPVATLLEVGTPVSAGQPVGQVADFPGHCPSRPCLHWGLRVFGVYHDPLLLVRRYRAVLLP